MEADNKETLTKEEITEHDKAVGDGSPYMDYFQDNNKDEDKNMDDFIEKLNELVNENPSQTREFKCPYCGDNLKLLEPGSAKYCKKCEKYFGGDYDTVGEEIENPYNIEGTIY